MATIQRDREVQVTPRRRSRRVLKWLALVVVALVAATVAYWALARSGAVPAPPAVSVGGTAAPAPTDVPTPVASPPAPAASQTRTANGCLGGEDPFQAVLAAQQSATPDQVGAAELALTFVRWSITYPVDPAADVVAERVAVPDYRHLVVSGLDDYRQTLLANGYTSASTTPGGADQYRVSSANRDQSSITLNLIVYRQATKASGDVESLRGYTTILLDLVDGYWQVSGTLPPIGSDPFAPDAGAPWIPFVGTC